MVIEQPISIHATGGLGVLEMLTEMGWDKNLLWGGEACLPLVDTMYASLSVVNVQTRTFNISY